jgi:methionine-rich copper-binding protein CopC
VGGTNPNQPNSGPGSLVASATDQTVVATNAPVEAVSIDNAYPNPFTDFVNLEFNNTNNNAYMAVEVYDLAGKKVMTQQVGAVAAGSTVLRINLAKTSLQPGVYMVRLNVNGLPSNTVKLVKAGK